MESSENLNAQSDSHSFTLEPADNQRLANVCGQFNEHLRLIEERLDVEINNRGNQFTVIGTVAAMQVAEQVLTQLFEEAAGAELKGERVHLLLQEGSASMLSDSDQKTQHGV